MRLNTHPFALKDFSYASSVVKAPKKEDKERGAPNAKSPETAQEQPSSETTPEMPSPKKQLSEEEKRQLIEEGKASMRPRIEALETELQSLKNAQSKYQAESSSQLKEVCDTLNEQFTQQLKEIEHASLTLFQSSLASFLDAGALAKLPELLQECLSHLQAEIKKNQPLIVTIKPAVKEACQPWLDTHLTANNIAFQLNESLDEAAPAIAFSCNHTHIHLDPKRYLEKLVSHIHSSAPPSSTTEQE